MSNRKLVVEITLGPIKGTIATYNMEAIEGKTRLNYTWDEKLGGLFKLVGPLWNVISPSKGKREIEGNAKRIGQQ